MTATINTLVSFNGANGAAPYGNLIANAHGDLFGTSSGGGANGHGTVFEIAKTASGYASTPTTLVSFSGADGSFPIGLLADAEGDLFSTTQFGGANGDGTVFEVAKTAGGYASMPTTLVSFNSADGSRPVAGLLADANGDLFGTTTGLDSSGNPLNAGTVFEIKNTAAGYASTPTTLVGFNDADGAIPSARLLADASGDLFGTTGFSGADGAGTVFEIAKTLTGYGSTPITLVSFTGDGVQGANSVAGLIADANGDLFGTTVTGGGANDDGTVYEIKKTAAGYASTPTTLVSFNGTNGAAPSVDLIADANGDLFGTTSGGGAANDGTVFEIKKTAAGYASAPTTLVSFNGADGSSPFASLIADANGDLFGTTTGFDPTTGHPLTSGTVFEITGSGFVLTATPASDGILFQGANGQAAIWGMDGTSVIAGGTVSPNPGPGWKSIGTGDFNDDGLPDLLWQNANGQAAIWDMNGTTLIGGGTVSPNPGPAWKAIGTGDFNDDGHTDILWQNADGQAAVWDMNGNTLIGGGAVNPNPGPAWKAIGTGDFNDDGHSDILWQNADGQAAIWEMNGSTLIGGGTVSPNPGPGWKAIGTGDFNDDGHSDILFQNASSGQVAIWEMNGNTLIGGGIVGANPGPSWHAIGTGDFNGDGHSDILFQSTSGQTAIWDMNGTSVIGGGAVSANPGPSWHAIGLT